MVGEVCGVDCGDIGGGYVYCVGVVGVGCFGVV